MTQSNEGLANGKAYTQDRQYLRLRKSARYGKFQLRERLVSLIRTIQNNLSMVYTKIARKAERNRQQSRIVFVSFCNGRLSMV